MSRYTLCAHLRLNRHEEAGQAISKALELYPDRPSLYEILGNIHVSRYTAFAYTETGDADLRAAVAVFRKAIAIDGSVPGRTTTWESWTAISTAPG